jgi:hypothetical protein
VYVRIDGRGSPDGHTGPPEVARGNAGRSCPGTGKNILIRRSGPSPPNPASSSPPSVTRTIRGVIRALRRTCSSRGAVVLIAPMMPGGGDARVGSTLRASRQELALECRAGGRTGAAENLQLSGQILLSVRVVWPLLRWRPGWILAAGDLARRCCAAPRLGGRAEVGYADHWWSGPTGVT